MPEAASPIDERAPGAQTGHGIGFDPERATHIFDAFTQANKAITREFGGLGLGLAIAKATIDGHGGSIKAHSPGRGQGATLCVDLPLACSEG